MKIRYSQPKELELEGSSNELKQLHDSILEFCDSEKTELYITVNSDFDPSPYDSVLSKFIVKKESGLNHFRVEENQLILGGEDKCLINFSRNIPFDAEQPSSGISYHVHYDWIGREDLVNQESLPIVITLEK